jgi:hypothetical protein
MLLLNDALLPHTRELAKIYGLSGGQARKAGWSVTSRNVGSEIQNSWLARSAHYDRKIAPEAKQRHAGKAHGDVPVDESMCKSPMRMKWAWFFLSRRWSPVP